MSTKKTAARREARNNRDDLLTQLGPHRTRSDEKLIRSLAENTFVRHTPASKAFEPIEAKTENQKRFLNAMKANTLTFATGPAGVGKTYLCTALAAQMLVNKQIKKIILTRPAVEADEHLGFLPGELEEKFDPYLQPYMDILEKRLGTSYCKSLIEDGTIVASPLAYMRGKTFDGSFVILDEAQNTTPRQMKMFLTRIGGDTKVVVNGDVEQSDLNEYSGLEDAVRVLRGLPGTQLVQFTVDDVVRSDIVGRIIRAYAEAPSLRRPGR